jgi:O-antigen ligase
VQSWRAGSGQLRMDGLLLTLFFFARPIMFIETGLEVAGLNFFELATIAFSCVLAVVAIINVMVAKFEPLSATEWSIAAFVVWCSAVALTYSEDVDFKIYVKMVLPLLTFIILKRAIVTRQRYVNLLWWCILGFAVPVVWSAVLIYRGVSPVETIYWTGLERYRGVYLNLHSMGHSMGFFLMLVTVFLVVTRFRRSASLPGRDWTKRALIAILVLCAVYCLGKGHVRTVYIGMLVFFFLVLLAYNRKAFTALSCAAVILTIVFAPLLATIFFDVVEPLQGKRPITWAGSGRPNIWKHNLEIYAAVPFDRQLAGVGIGNTMRDNDFYLLRPKSSLLKNVWQSHNDFLELIMETGAIGFVLMLLVNVFLFLSIWRSAARERYVFLACFGAVGVMNALSNGYVSFFGVAQLYWMLMSYVELPETQGQETSQDAKVGFA